MPCRGSGRNDGHGDRSGKPDLRGGARAEGAALPDLFSVGDARRGRPGVDSRLPRPRGMLREIPQRRKADLPAAETVKVGTIVPARVGESSSFISNRGVLLRREHDGDQRLIA